MSTQYKSSRDVPTEVLAARLNELADVVAQKHDRIGAEFAMRIPAECDRDADLVMAEAARRLSAAPAVHGEPVAWQRVDRPERIVTTLSRRTWQETNDGVGFIPLYTAPQPAEQQPDTFNGDDETLISSAKSLLALDAKGALSPHGIGGHARGIISAFIARMNVEQQPAQDVAGLESALKSMVSGYMRLLQSGYDRITDLGGDCDPVDVMERDDTYLREARATLAAHRKGGE